MKLYEITGALRDVLEMDIPEDQKADTIEELGLDFNAKIDGCLAYRQEQLSKSEMYKAEIDRLTALKKAAESRANSMSEYVKRNMIALDIKKHEGLFNATIGKPSQRVEVSNESILPPEYLLTKITVNKSKLSTDLKNGSSIDGALLVDGEPRFIVK